MIIKKLVLNDYGIYYGKNEFNFNISPDKNLVIIGGKNGSGKTTMLEAIKIAIYGPLYCGSKNAGKTYIEKIKNKINSKAISEGSPDSYVEIHIKMAQDGDLNDYIIKRRWQMINDTLKEDLIIKKNGKMLTDAQIVDLDEYIRKFMPKDLFDFFFFDGEKMKDLLESLMFEKVLKKDMMTLFNLDLFHYLKSDLSKYLHESNTFKNLKEEQKILEKLTGLKNEYQQKHDEYSSKIDKFQEKFSEIEIEIVQLNKDLENQGKLSDSEKSELHREIKDLEVEMKKIQDGIKEFAGELLPFVILREQVKGLKKAVKKQENLRSYETFQKIDQKELKTILNENYNKKYPIDEIILKINDYYRYKLVENCNAASISPLSVEDGKKVEHIIKEVSEFDKDALTGYFKTLLNIKDKIKSKQAALRISENNEDLKIIMNAITDKTVEKEKLKFKIEEFLKIKEEMAKKVSETEKEISKIDLKISQALKDEKKVLIVNGITNVVDKFTTLKNKEKSQELKENFLEMFFHLMRKEDFIADIDIELDTLDIKLYDKKGSLIKTELLSEGERQIYVLSLLYSLIKTSGRKIPVVLDSLLGRLDLSHKYNILHKFLPMVGNQAIVLSTDAEINSNDFKKLERYVSKSYVIDFSSEKKQINIQKSYF